MPTNEIGLRETGAALDDALRPLRTRYYTVFARRGSSTADQQVIDLLASALYHGQMDEETARDMIRAIEPAPEWWSTPLGQMFFQAGGFPLRNAASLEAEAVLRRSRARIWQLADEGKLERLGTFVTRESLATHWATLNRKQVTA